MKVATTDRVDISVRRCADVDARVWDDFVEKSVNGTLMQTRRFLSYHAPERFADHSLMFFEGQELVAVMTAADSASSAGRELRSHPGATYGGLVFAENPGISRAQRVVDALTRYAAHAGFHRIWMRCAERVFHRDYCEEIDAALFRGGFQIQGRELSAAARTTETDLERVVAQFRPPARTAARKAIQQRVTTRWTDDWPGYWQILKNNLAAEHGVTPTHSLEEIRRLTHLFPDRVLLLGGYVDDRLVAGTVLFLMNSQAAHCMYMAQDYQYQGCRSMNLLLAAAIAECARRQLRWLNFGISSIPGSRGLEMNEGLYYFKRNCGGRGTVRDQLAWDRPSPSPAVSP